MSCGPCGQRACVVHMSTACQPPHPSSLRKRWSLRQVESKERCCSSDARLEISGPPSSFRAANTTCDESPRLRKRPMAPRLLSSNLSTKTLRKHRYNLWQLGGDIISVLAGSTAGAATAKSATQSDAQ